MMLADDPIALAARHSFGYGSWSAPYWFIGPEPGKAKKEGNNLPERCQAWLEMCPDGPSSGGVIDCREHHRRFGVVKFWETAKKAKRPPTQDTWRQLIRLLLAYQKRPCDNDAIADYQSTEWGRKDGKTCVVEMSALAMNRVSDEQALRKRFWPDRANRLRDEIAANHPEFVVMYGGGRGLRPWWQLIACGRMATNCFTKMSIEGWEVDFAIRSGTVFVVAKHPVNPGGKAPADEYWTGVAAEIRRLREVM